MEQKLGRVPVMILLLIAAVAAYFLRLDQLQAMSVFIQTHRLTWVCVVLVAVFAVYSWFLRPRKKSNALSGRGLLPLICTMAAATGMVLGCLAMVRDLENDYDLLVAAGGAVTAICWAVVGLERFQGRKLPAPLFMIPALFYAIRLILDFRNWSRDPMILDYCFDLLALICVMCATFHYSGFCFEEGKRRLSVFFPCCGILFGAIAIAGGRMRELAMTGGAMLWLVANLWVLLRPSRKRQSNREEKPAE